MPQNGDTVPAEDLLCQAPNHGYLYTRFLLRTPLVSGPVLRDFLHARWGDPQTQWLDRRRPGRTIQAGADDLGLDRTDDSDDAVYSLTFRRTARLLKIYPQAIEVDACGYRGSRLRTILDEWLRGAGYGLYVERAGQDDQRWWVIYYGGSQVAATYVCPYRDGIRLDFAGAVVQRQQYERAHKLALLRQMTHLHEALAG